MAITNQKEITQKLNCGLKCIKEAIELAKRSIVVGEINYTGTKPGRKPRAKKTIAVESPTPTTGQE